LNQVYDEKRHGTRISFKNERNALGAKIRAVSWHTELAGAFLLLKKGFVVHHRDTYPGACQRYTKSRDSRRLGMKEAATAPKKE
jgi:hypothetical protein